MAVYRDPKSPFWQIEFQLDGCKFRQSSKTGNKKEAEALERELRATAKTEAAERKRLGTGPMTLDTAAGRYMTEVMTGKSSEAGAFKALQRLIAFIGGSTLMAKVTDAHVSAYIAKRRKDCRYGKTKRADKSTMGTLSNASINREVQVLKRLFMRARRTWKISLPNEPDWRGHHLQEGGERIREINEDEAEKLYGGIRPDFLPWLRFAHASGLRLEETLIRWSEINWKTGVIRVKGKGGRWMVTQITPTIRDILEPLKGHHKDWVFTFIANRADKELERARGGRYPLTYAGIQSEWRRLKERAGIKDLRIHDIRHDAATAIVRVTGNLKIAQKLLNHSSISTTARYAHVTGKDMVDAMELVEKSRKASRINDEKAA